MRSFANASAISGDWKWSEMIYVVQRGPGIIKVATEHKPLLHSVLSQTFHHLKQFELWLLQYTNRIFCVSHQNTLVCFVTTIT